MSKKRANKSKRRRESQRPQASTSNAARAQPAREPKLHLITGGADAASGIRAVSAANESGDASELSPESAPSEMPAAVAAAPAARDEKTPDAKPADAGASVEDLEEEARFFHEGRIQTPHAFTVADDLDEAEAPKPSPKMTPIARARRAHFSKYVKGAMVAATAILTLAGIRLALGRSDRAPEPYATTATALAAPQPATTAMAAAVAAVDKPAEKPAEPAPIATVGNTSAQIPAPVAEVAATPDPKTEKAEAPKAEATPTPPAPEPAKAEPAKAEPAKAEPAKAEVPAGDKTAAQEKVEARRLLERGKSAQAIEAGERSVALDPTDGEAWLILGAAYQDKGNLKDARRAFQSCTKEGKRGPIGECRAMLQQ